MPPAWPTRRASADTSGVQRTTTTTLTDRDHLLLHATPDRSGCWIFSGSLRGGYGRVANRAAHRIAWEQFHGTIPARLQVHHRCGTKACVNPDHLELVTQKQHSQIGLRDRCARGHLYDEENTLVRTRGGRACRACARQHARDYRGRVRELETVPGTDAELALSA
jgi:hypothetical protein